MRPIRLQDTRSGSVLPLEPRESPKVGIYACGPTVYNRIHIGNARPFVVFSLLRRFLAASGYEPTLVVNVTDVNDKIYDAAKAAGEPSSALAERMTALYKADTDLLGLGRPDAEPLASQTIGPIVALIADLIEGGHAYENGGDVFFRVGSDAGYGSLSNRRVEDMSQGEDVESTELKESPLDFALWKAQKPGEDTAWDSPWGPGRPGWHIECSAMAEELLGVDFEIHGGGSDLVFPHHENEAAQTRSARGSELARIWMHNGMLQFGREKMAKSVGNIVSLADAVERWGRDTLVLFFSTAHYRQPIQYTDEALEAARNRLAGLREAARRVVPGPSPEDLAPVRERFFAALADDFNTPAALAALAEWVAEANRRSEVGDADLRAMLGVLGLETLFEGGREPTAEDRSLLEARQAARAAKDFGEADRLRDELRSRGWEVRDGASGAELIPVDG
jgi:cysteinyl-tRNA synthetase